MKVPTSNLFSLVQAMSASEKRYFKRHYASENNLTTELFDYINSQESYNEESVKQHFNHSKLSKNLKVYKVQLSDLLLKSLVSYYAKKSIRSKIRQGLEEIDILLEKQLYEVALNKCRKLKELAIYKQEKEYLIPILECEIKLINFFKGKPEFNVQKSVEEVLENSAGLVDLYKLKALNYQLSSQNNQDVAQVNSIQSEKEAMQLIKTSLKIEEQDHLLSKFYKNSSSAILYKLILNDPRKELAHKENNIHLFAENKHLIENNSSVYFAALYNYLVACRVHGKVSELEAGLKNISKLVKENPSLGRNALYIYYLEVKHLYENNKFVEIKDRIEPLVIQHVKKYRQDKEHLTVLSFIYFSLNNLILKDYHQVHFYLRRLFDKSKGLNNNYLRLFDVIELLSHLETEDFKVADILISTLKRRFRTQKDPSSFYTFILNALKEILQANPKDRITLNEQFIGQWDNYTSDSFYQLADSFFLRDWKKALTNNATFAHSKNG